MRRIFVIGVAVIVIFGLSLFYCGGGGPDIFGYVFTDNSPNNIYLEPDAPMYPSDEAKKLAQEDPNNTECVQNAETQSFFRCLTIAGTAGACRIGSGIGVVVPCPNSSDFQEAFNSDTESCYTLETTPGPFFGTFGFGFTFYGEVAALINICPSGFITINASPTFTGINSTEITDANGQVIGIKTELIERKFPNRDDETTEKLEGFPATIAAYYTFLDSTPDASVGGSGVYLLYIPPDGRFLIGPNLAAELLIIEYNNVTVMDEEGATVGRSTFQIVLFGRVFDITDPNNPQVVDELDLIVVKYERAASDNITFRLGGINAGDGLNGLTWKSGIFNVYDTAVSYIISSSPPPSKLFVNDSIRGAQKGFEGNPVIITTFFPVMSAIFEGRKCERAFAAKIQIATDPEFLNITCGTKVIKFPVEIPPSKRSPNITPDPCQGQNALKPFVQYYWRIMFWKREYPKDENGNCDIAGTPDEPDRTLFTSTTQSYDIDPTAKPNSFIICNTCSKSGAGGSLGLPGGDEGGARPVLGSFTGQGSGGASGGSCTIATASLNNEKKLALFRYVRNNYILTSHTGKKFILLYYKYSYKIAKVISKNKLIKYIFQITIATIYSYISFIHTCGFLIKFSLLFALIVLFYLRNRFTLA